MNKLVVLLAALVALAACAAAEKHMICYYGSWATYRQEKGKCTVQHLDPFVCTHLIYTFVGLNDDATVRIMDPWLELPDNWGKDNFGNFNKLKTINPKLKTIIAIGGWNEGSARYSTMANNPALRTKFAKNAAEFTIKYGFDGFDLDWEYPGQRDSTNPATDIEAHRLLLKEMREVFDEHGLLLTAAVASVKKSALQSYNIPEISKYLDLINVMTYDLHGAWDPITGHNSALHHYEENVAKEDSFDVETAMQFWLDSGAPKEKLILGIPLYGHTFALANTDDTSVGAKITGPGIRGQYSGQNGFMGLNELCEKRLQGEKWPELWDDVAKVPYSYNNRDWISYENMESLRLKTQLAMDMDLGGVMIWSIETDDFNGVCHDQKYPYLRLLNEVLGREIDENPNTPPPTSSTTTQKTTTTTGSGPPGTTTEGKPHDLCTKPGYVRDKKDCAIFYLCVGSASDGWTVFDFSCPPGLFFDDVQMLCNYADLVDCKNSKRFY